MHRTQERVGRTEEGATGGGGDGRALGILCCAGSRSRPSAASASVKRRPAAIEPPGRKGPWEGLATAGGQAGRRFRRLDVWRRRSADLAGRQCDDPETHPAGERRPVTSPPWRAPPFPSSHPLPGSASAPYRYTQHPVCQPHRSICARSANGAPAAMPPRRHSAVFAVGTAVGSRTTTARRSRSAQGRGGSVGPTRFTQLGTCTCTRHMVHVWPNPDVFLQTYITAV